MDQLESENSYVESLSEELSDYLGTKAQIKENGQRGTVEIEYLSPDDLDQLVEKLKRCNFYRQGD